MRLEHKNLTQIPQRLMSPSELQSLVRLQIGHNELTELPRAIFKFLVFLEVLSVENNQLKSIPYTVKYA